MNTHEKALSYCAYCPKLCRFSCPVSEATASETLTPWGKQSILFDVERRIVPLTAEYAGVFYACLECHRCMTFCDHGIDVPLSLLEGRRAALAQGCAPPRTALLARSFAENEEKARGILETEFPLLTQTGGRKTLLMPGCTAAIKQIGAVGRAIAAARELMGDEFGLLAQHCCGLPLLAAGDVAGFTAAARRFAEAVRTVRNVIVLDPGCAHALAVLYARHGVELAPKVVTFVELVAGHVERLRRKVKLPPPVFYHDPCRLGRDLGVYSPPRDILMKCVAGGIRDLLNNREKALCCGGGGGLPVTMPDTARQAASNLAAELKKHGAASVVTACPTCTSMLADAAPHLHVCDITTVIADSLGC